MTVKILAIDKANDDNTIIAVCIANYLKDRGINNENIHVVRVLEKIFDKLPNITKNTITDTFKLNDHLTFTYIEKDKTDMN